MTEVIFPQEDGETVVVDLRDPYWAAFLAWCWPGAGHFYQRRWAKGYLFMICVLSTFFYGLFIGRGHVVYASFRTNDFRWQYVCQLGAGAVALPAVAQAIKTQDGGEPFFVTCERHGPNSATPFLPVTDENPARGDTLKDGFMAPPAGEIDPRNNDVLGQWNIEMKHLFEIGTLFTVVAGLLNLLAIYDAFCGPAILTPEQREKLESKRKRKKRKQEEELS